VSRAGLLLLAMLLVALCAAVSPVSAADEEPRYPARTEQDIGDRYQFPSPSYPEPRDTRLRYTDVLVLAATLLLAAWIILRFRDRWSLVILVVFSLCYFGFYRAGCICPIGAIQNVVLSAVDRNYTISIVVTAIFLLPILATLLFGRVFCGGVCPLGAIQDLMLRKPIRVPMLLDKILGYGRWVYLAIAVYFVVGGLQLVVFGRDLAVTRHFLICEYDPFVNVFRAFDLSKILTHEWGRVFRLVGPWWLWIITGVLLGGGVFIGRPYCRWLCPYGAILGACSRLSWRKVTVMPGECIDCELCNDACPLGAIEKHAAVRSTCQACNRCYSSCPMERKRRWLPSPAGPAPATVSMPPAALRPVPVERAPVRGRRMAVHDEPIDLSYLDAVLAQNGTDGDAALPILQAVQARHGYLPHPALLAVVQRTGISMAKLIGLATFYNQFRLAPIGKHLVKVCCGTACHVAGAKRVSDSVRLYLGLTGDADTDAARRFTVQEVACIGCCSLAPVMQIDETTFGHLTAETAAMTIETYTPASHKRHVEPPPSHDTVVDDTQHHKGVTA
jgi:NADH:ubiquinone oxidoreductase subunit E/NAD-dependent dihydropyrimidine dehydrogenase PreA subunit